MFELRFRHTDITALQPYLRHSSAFTERAARHRTKETIVRITTQTVSLNSAEYGTSTRRLLLRLATTSKSHRLVPTARCCLSKQGGRSDANALRWPADRPSAGQNCPHVPLTILRPNCPLTSPYSASTRSLAGVHASVSIARITVRRVLKTAPSHLARRMPCSRRIC